MSIDLEAIRNAPSGVGPLASGWRDKPHRLLYDLLAEVDRLRQEIERLNEELRGPDLFATVSEQQMIINRVATLTRLGNAMSDAIDSGLYLVEEHSWSNLLTEAKAAWDAEVRG